MIRTLLASLLVIVTLGVVVAPTVQAIDLFNNACSTNGYDSAVCQDKGKGSSDPLTGANGLLRKVANIIAVIAGLSAIIVIIVSGLQYIGSSGDPSKAEAAKKTLVYAIVGLIVIALAGSITSLVLSKL